MRPEYQGESTEEMRKAERGERAKRTLPLPLPIVRQMKAENTKPRRMMGAPNREGFRSIMSYGPILPAIRRDFQWPIRFVRERMRDSLKIEMKVEKCVGRNDRNYGQFNSTRVLNFKTGKS